MCTGNDAEQLGMGLLMVKRLMVACGGQLRINNRPEAEGKGCCVELVFRTKPSSPYLTAQVKGDQYNMLRGAALVEFVS